MKILGWSIKEAAEITASAINGKMRTNGATEWSKTTFCETWNLASAQKEYDKPKCWISFIKWVDEQNDDDRERWYFRVRNLSKRTFK